MVQIWPAAQLAMQKRSELVVECGDRSTPAIRCIGECKGCSAKSKGTMVIECVSYEFARGTAGSIINGYPPIWLLGSCELAGFRFPASPGSSAAGGSALPFLVFGFPT